MDHNMNRAQDNKTEQAVELFGDFGVANNMGVTNRAKRDNSFSFDIAFSDIIRNYDIKHFYILGHMNPDGDCVGSVMGLAHYIRTEYPVAAVHPYLAKVTEKGPGWFLSKDRIFENPCSLFEVPSEYGVITCDTATRKRLIGNELLEKAKIVMAIDHHASHEKYENLGCVKTTESCADLIYQVLDKEKLAHNRDLLRAEDSGQPTAADYLYLGILHDTGCFKRAKQETLSSGAELLSMGVNHKWIMKTLETKTYEDYKKEAMLIGKADWYFDGRVAGLLCDRSYAAEHEISYDDIHSISGKLRDFAGVDVGFTMYEETPGVYRCSFRSDGETVNVNELVLPYGGGGHVGAAGLKIETKDAIGLRDEIIAKIGGVLRTDMES